jgi:DNA-binding GntR family transcriptional regulator
VDFDTAPPVLSPGELRVERAMVRDQSYQSLRRAIVTGYFAPGQRLIERNLCELLGVSRTSIREALRMLESEKLISVEPQKGPCVRLISETDANHIYEVRRVLESLAGELAARHATDEQIDALGRSLDAFSAAVEARDLPALVELAAQFYDILFQACQNNVIREVLGQLNARVSVLRGLSMSDPGRSQLSCAEMKEIYDAVKARDSTWAAAACAGHVTKAAAAARKHFSTPLFSGSAADAGGASAGRRGRRKVAL